jgi:hypothetical protein
MQRHALPRSVAGSAWQPAQTLRVHRCPKLAAEECNTFVVENVATLEYMQCLLVSDCMKEDGARHFHRDACAVQSMVTEDVQAQRSACMQGWAHCDSFCE